MVLERPAPREPFEPQAFAEAMARCRRTRAADPGLLDLADALFAVQKGLCEELAGAGAVVIPEADWLRKAAPAVAATVAAKSPSAPKGLGRLAEALGGAAAGAALAAVWGDSEALLALSAETGIEPPVLLFVLRNAMQSYYARVRHSSEDTGVPHPARQSCPACGGRPLMARHAEPDGHRFLNCSACGREWAYPRVACPACGGTDQDRLEVLYLPGSEGHRVYLCAACGRYTKVADERLLGGPAYLPLEDLVTLHLDELARERGYTPVSEEGPSPQDAGQTRFH